LRGFNLVCKTNGDYGVAEPRDELISGSRLKLIGDLQHHPANQQRRDYFSVIMK
jgi:hypothetical protein